MTRADHLRAALVSLHRAEHLRLGPNRDDYLGQAANHLRDAGLPDLAERCEEETGFGGPGEDVIAAEFAARSPDRAMREAMQQTEQTR